MTIMATDRLENCSEAAGIVLTRRMDSLEALLDTIENGWCFGINHIRYLPRHVDILRAFVHRHELDAHVGEAVSELLSSSVYVIPMVCFTEFNPHEIESEQLNLYGEYGIAMTMRWAASRGIMQVHYWDEQGVDDEWLTRSLDNLHQLERPMQARELRRILGFTEPRRHDSDAEWRIIADHNVLSFDLRAQFRIGDIVRIDVRGVEAEEEQVLESLGRKAGREQFVGEFPLIYRIPQPAEEIDWGEPDETLL